VLLYKRSLLIFLFLSSIFVNSNAISKEETMENAMKLSTRIMPTRLKYHQLKKMWAKGYNYCLGKPEEGVGEYKGIYVQRLLERVPTNGICIFEDPEKTSGDFILNRKTQTLTKERL